MLASHRLGKQYSVESKCRVQRDMMQEGGTPWRRFVNV
jgi:hypothetical protein